VVRIRRSDPAAVLKTTAKSATVRANVSVNCVLLDVVGIVLAGATVAGNPARRR
jgi:hypothetical protein